MYDRIPFLLCIGDHWQGIQGGLPGIIDAFLHAKCSEAGFDNCNNGLIGGPAEVGD